MKVMRAILPSYFAGKGSLESNFAEEQPLRAELFGSDQMQQHGRNLAKSHALHLDRLPDRLLTRLAENERVLVEVCRLLTEVITASRQIAPAGEWLLDNFYLIEEQIRTAKRHLPQGYSRELPRLLNGPSAGLPRVYDIALEIISHGDGRVSTDSLSSFVASYQSVTVLKLGELWAIPIMLRLALIENLRRITARIAIDMINRNLALQWADQMVKTAAEDSNNLILVLADMARSNPPMVSSFVAELTRSLKGQGPALALPLTWMEQRLSESGLTIELLVQLETQQQAADQVSVSSSIGSLRYLSAMDWREFVERMSIVEQILQQDPADVYGRMDFATRDRYRHVIEKIAARSFLAESQVAGQVIELAREAATEKVSNDRRAHVGFFLIDAGLPRLLKKAEVHFSLTETIRKVTRRLPLPVYSGTILLLTSIFAGLLTMKATAEGVQSWPLALLGLLIVFAASQPAVALVNWLTTLLATPQPLPRMDLSEGIPAELRTLVVVPTMLTDTDNIEELVEALEVRFLANRDDHLHFGLLTDFRDAGEENLVEDEPLLSLARRKITELNEKYPTAGEGDAFYLFHRPRRWNPRDKMWMGHERKRGKIADLNRLLRDTDDQCLALFALVVGDTTVLSTVKYVITLDTDTLLARDSAWRFIGAMAHTLNRPLYDEEKQRVVSGYGILQPRVAISLSGANRSSYARLCGSDPGIDPYTRAVSDVYQDLFGEGSFIGKGIYEVDAFERALAGRFPDNLILSHDLLEGCYARAGLQSDVQLYEEYPSRYSADVNRRYRWIRGDWQIARWLLPWVPGPGGQLRKNPLSMLSRWKILDNLRRSLMAAAFVLLLLLGWTVLASPLFWTLAVIGMIVIPSLLASALNILQKPADVTLGQHLANTLHAAGRQCLQALFTLVCLPYEAIYSLDALLRTVWRMHISHRRLLQWNPSADSNTARTDLLGSCRSMWSSPTVAVVSIVMLALLQPLALVVAGPILALWFFSPLITWWISRPLPRRTEKLTNDQTLFLRRLARKTWSFFETFVCPADHWLPPDNFQEHPVGVIAHRTSPTNMGLALLANLSAYDFGYISAGRFLERTANAMDTMETMERHRGHFYNWYNTQTLRPLFPLYISSVDSGNLAGHLLTLAPGLRSLADEPIVSRQLFSGLADTLEVIGELAGSALLDQRAELKKELDQAIAVYPPTLTALRLCLLRLARTGDLMANE
jgi:cyclic beta-1,2-glucan synthetase